MVKIAIFPFFYYVFMISSVYIGKTFVQGEEGAYKNTKAFAQKKKKNEHIIYVKSTVGNKFYTLFSYILLCYENWTNILSSQLKDKILLKAGHWIQRELTRAPWMQLKLK